MWISAISRLRDAMNRFCTFWSKAAQQGDRRAIEHQPPNREAASAYAVSAGRDQRWPQARLRMSSACCMGGEIEPLGRLGFIGLSPLLSRIVAARLQTRNWHHCKITPAYLRLKVRPIRCNDLARRRNRDVGRQVRPPHSQQQTGSCAQFKSLNQRCGG
jgi:hypothetical protein